MTQTIIAPSIAMVNGQPSASSLDIAEHFQKRHAEVLRSIRNVASECPPDFIERNFALKNYFDGLGRELPMYHLSRDGFTLLAMGFAGKKALTWKIRYIQAFNAMEKALLDQSGRKQIRQEKQKALPPPTMARHYDSPQAALEVPGASRLNELHFEIKRHIRGIEDAMAEIHGIVGRIYPPVGRQDAFTLSLAGNNSRAVSQSMTAMVSLLDGVYSNVRATMIACGV